MTISKRTFTLSTVFRFAQKSIFSPTDSSTVFFLHKFNRYQKEMRSKREVGQNGRPIRTCPDSWKVIIKKILNLVDAKEILQIYKNR